MKNLEKISNFEAISLILIIITNQIILNLPNSILTSTGSSAVLNVIYISIIALIFVFIVCKLFKKFTSKDLLDISEFLGGKTLKFIIGILYIVLFIFITSTLLRYFSETLKLIYFKDAPIILIVLAFLIPPIIINNFGLNVVSRVNLFFIPILLISMIFLAYTSLKNFDSSQIFPVLGYGTKETFFIGLSNIFAFGGIGYIFFLNPLLKNSKDFSKVAISSIIFSAISLLLSVICLIMVLPFLSYTDEILSIYLITKTVELGRFLQRIDAIFIFFWIFATLSYISVNLFYISNILKKITNIKNSNEMVYVIATIIFSVSLITRTVAEIKFFEKVIYKYFMIILIFGISFLILLLANIKNKKKGLLSNE